MSYKGTLRREIPFFMEVVGSASAPVGITVVKINQRGGMHATPTTIPIAATVTLNDTLGSRIVRMLVHANPPAGGTVRITLYQGATQYSDVSTSDAVFVYDAIP
jgi:hypothetical protein